MKFLTIPLLCLFLIQTTTSNSTVFAQSNPDNATNQTKQDPVQQRIEYDAYDVISKEQNTAKKYEAAQAFLTKYPNSTYISYVKQNLNFARYVLCYEYRNSGKYDDEFRVGDEFLKESAENKPKSLQDLAILLVLGNDAGFFALQGKNQYLENGAKYAKQAIDLIESGKKIEDPKIDWEAEKSKYLAQMYRTVGIGQSNAKKGDEAITALTKSIDFDCTDPYTYYFIALIYQQRYEDAAKKFNSIPAKTSTEATEALKTAKANAEKVAEFFGKTIAAGQISKEATKYDKLITACKGNIETPYKITHDQKSDGLNEYIESLKTNICKK